MTISSSLNPSGGALFHPVAPSAQRLLQVLVVGRAERRLQHLAAVALHALDQLLALLRAAERDQRGRARAQPGAEVLHERVVDTLVGELSADRAAGGPDRGAQQRGQEE